MRRHRLKLMNKLNPANGKFTHYLFNGNTRDNSRNKHHGGESGCLSYAADRFSRAGRVLVLNGSDAISAGNAGNPASSEHLLLMQVYSNLVRMWAEI